MQWRSLTYCAYDCGNVTGADDQACVGSGHPNFATQAGDGGDDNIVVGHVQARVDAVEVQVSARAPSSDGAGSNIPACRCMLCMAVQSPAAELSQEVWSGQDESAEPPWHAVLEGYAKHQGRFTGHVGHL